MYNLSTVLLYTLMVLEDDDIILSSSVCTFNSSSVQICVVNSIQGVYWLQLGEDGWMGSGCGWCAPVGDLRMGN